YVRPEEGDNSASAIAVDRRGNVLVTGDSATIAYSSAGVPLWTNRHDGSASGLALDTAGNVFTTGTSIGVSGNAYSSGFATVAYSNAGLPLWTNRYSTPQNYYNKANAITVDSHG